MLVVDVNVIYDIITTLFQVFGFISCALFVAEVVINSHKLRRGNYMHDVPTPQPVPDNITVSSAVGSVWTHRHALQRWLGLLWLWARDTTLCKSDRTPGYSSNNTESLLKISKGSMLYTYSDQPILYNLNLASMSYQDLTYQAINKIFWHNANERCHRHSIDKHTQIKNSFSF